MSTKRKAGDRNGIRPDTVWMTPGMLWMYGTCSSNEPAPGGIPKRGNSFPSSIGERYRQFLDGTVLLRKQFNEKRFDYQEALRNPNSTREQLAQMEKEIKVLQEKIYGKVGRNKL